MWIWYVSASSHGNLSAIVSTARTYGISTLMIKAGDGATAWVKQLKQTIAVLGRVGPGNRRSGLSLTVPRSARLPARRDEIPRDHGAGARATG